MLEKFSIVCLPAAPRALPFAPSPHCPDGLDFDGPDSDGSPYFRVQTFHWCFAFLPNPENISRPISVEVSLLSCIQVGYALCHFYYQLQAAIFPNKSTCRAVFDVVESCCLTLKHGYSRENFIAIVYASWDICNVISTSGKWPPSSIPN